MASPVKQQAPDVLPPDFNQWDQDSSPETLPPDFFDKQDQTAATDPRNKLQKAFDELTTVTPEQEKGHSWLTNKAQEFGAGAIGSLSPLVHPIDTIKGVGNAIAHPANTAKAIGNDAMEHPAQTLGSLVGGAVTGGLAAEAGAPLLAKIPTRARAGKLFDQVMTRASDEPVTLTKALQPMERAQQISARGGGTISPIDNLYKRINTVNPLDYKEARDWASNLSRLSANDKMNASPALMAEAKKLSHAFNEDVGGAAARRGVGPQYDQAMTTYRQAARNAEIAKKVAKWGGAAGAGALGVGGVHQLVKSLQ